MQNIPEAEARSLVSRPLICEEIDEWEPLKVQPGTSACGVGVLDESGQSVRMYVEFIHRASHKTKITIYLFTLFKRQAYGKERVYQLEVTQTPKRVKDLHKLSHEHMGSLRTLGGVDWADWDYDDVLAHFCAATNITFRPKPSHPDEFKLTADR
jgi:hypothetical protein